MVTFDCVCSPVGFKEKVLWIYEPKNKKYSFYNHKHFKEIQGN